MKTRLKKILSFFGVQQDTTTHCEKLISAAGGFLGILAVYFICSGIVHGYGAAMLTASIGASAVLLFGVPHSALVQPWPIIGGHLVSAVTGVASYQLIHDPLFAAPLAVALAIGAMHYLRCLHPPGGGTALAAAAGGTTVYELGYQFVITPVLMNVLVILTIAIVVNNLFSWRRYPLSLMRHRTADNNRDDDELEISHSDVEYALKEMQSYIDVTEDDLIEILRLARKHHAEESRLDLSRLKVGLFYSNGAFGQDWVVRQIIGLTDNIMPNRKGLIYKVVAGRGRGATGVCTPGEFLDWACYKVIRRESHWCKAA